MLEIPVALVSPDGGVTTDPVVGVPCIRISISANEDGSPRLLSAWALLDTGADNIFVESSLSAAIGAHSTGTTPVHSATGIVEQPTYCAFISIEGLPALATGFSEVPLPRAHGRYHVVLGRAFLRLFDFRFSRQTQAFSLWHHTQGPQFRLGVRA